MVENTFTKKVLVVEDEEDIAFVLKIGLEKAGLQTVLATTGEEAWDTIVSQRPDIIVLDIMLPKLDGISLNQRLKKREDTKNIPVIVITGRGQLREMFTTHQENWITDFIEKPFSIKLLIEKIQKLL